MYRGLGAVAVAAVLCVAAASGAAGVAAASGSVASAAPTVPISSTFITVGNLPASSNGTYDVACSSPLDCLLYFDAVTGGASTLSFTTDGGVSWTAGTVPPDGARAITCATKSKDCWAISNGSSGATVDATTDLGASWTSQALPTDLSAALGISCPSSSDCVISGADDRGDCSTLGCAEFAVTTDGGASWRGHAGHEADAVGVSCPTTSTCFAVVDSEEVEAIATFVEESTDGGATWTELSGAANGGQPYAIDCPTAAFCAIGGQAAATDDGWLATTSDGGTTWTTVTQTDAAVASISCGVADRCLATDGQGWVTTDGSSWTGSLSRSGEVLNEADCPAAGTCFVAAVKWSSGPPSLPTPSLLSSRDATGLGCVGTLAGQTAVAMAVTPRQSGYLAAASDGGVVACGTAHFEGSLRNKAIPAPIVGIATATKKDGYYLLGRDGTVFTFGPGGTTRGSGPHSASPYVGIAVDPSTGGYWVTTASGRVTGIGAPAEAPAGGSLTGSIAGIVAAPEGNGYYLFTSTGAVEAFGTTTAFRGDLYTSHVHAGAPVTGLAVEPGERGYFLIARNGGVFRFGTATTWHGAMTGTASSAVEGGAAAGFSEGYWLLDSEGAIYSLGAPFYGAPG